MACRNEGEDITKLPVIDYDPGILLPWWLESKRVRDKPSWSWMMRLEQKAASHETFLTFHSTQVRLTNEFATPAFVR